MHVPTCIKDAAFKIFVFGPRQTRPFDKVHVEIQIPLGYNIDFHSIANKLALVYDNDSYKLKEDKQVCYTKDNDYRNNLPGEL